MSISHLPDPSLVMEAIEGWRKIDLAKVLDDEIDEKLKELIKKLYVIPISGYHSAPRNLYRVRTCHRYLDNLDEFWAPPDDKTPLGRCNAKGSPVLYVSENSVTPFEEISVKPFSPFYFIKYKTNEKLMLHEVVSDDFAPQDWKTNELVYKDSELLSYQILREFIRSEFLRHVGDETNYLYKISASICRVWFAPDKADGWRYPSIRLQTHKNIALKPNVALQKLEIESLQIVMLIPFDLLSSQLSGNNEPFINFYEKGYNLRCLYEGKIEGRKVSWIASDAHNCYFK